MRIQHNIAALNSYRNLTTNNNAVSKNLEKLSSGYRINRAGDDAAGLAISEKMRAQITGLETAQKNANDGISLVQTAEGALTEVHSMLNRMVELAEQSANGTYDNSVDRVQLQKEVESLQAEINRIADSSNFNGIKLLDGTSGLNSDAFETSFGGAEAVKKSDGNIAGSDLVQAANGHVEEKSATAVDAKFSVDLTGLTITTNDASTKDLGTNGKITVGILDESIEIVMKHGTTEDNELDTSTALNKTANDLAGVLKNAFLKSGLGFKMDSTATDNDSIKIEGTKGKYVFEIGAANNGAIEFTFKGTVDDAGKYSEATAKPLTEEQAAEINSLIGQKVSVSITAPVGDTEDLGFSSTEAQIHNTTKVTQAVAKKDGTLAGADIKLSADMMVNNGQLTIDGQTFEFKVDDEYKASAGVTTINLSDFKGDMEDKDALIHYAVDKLSQETVTGKEARTWTISSAGDDTIHIDQTNASTSGKELKTIDDVVALVSGKGTQTDAKNVGSTVKISASKITEGDKLTIGDKTFTFTQDADKAADDTTGMTILTKGKSNKEVLEAMKAKLDNAELNNAGDTLIVRAATADEAAPKIMGAGLKLQIGDTADAYNQMKVELNDCHVAALDIDDLDISNQQSAAEAMGKIKHAINYVSDVRGTLGALQNRLEHTINNLSVQTENITAAESRIRDVDMAEEMMAYTKNNILVQASQAMLAQANQIPQGVLQLLQ